jgi:RNA polymerase-associated protein RTF1
MRYSGGKRLMVAVCVCGCRFGKQERVFRMEYVSNSAFTEQEFTKWKSENEAHSIRLPTVFEIDKKVREIEKRKNTSLKEEDIDQIIIEKQKFRKNPHNYALTKNRLLREMVNGQYIV